MSQAFDAVANVYDEQFTETQTGRLQRDLVHARLRQLVANAGRPLRVLEVNCGTGADAIFLAGLGCEVVATDASPEMVEVTRRKAEAAGLSHRIQTAVLVLPPQGRLPEPVSRGRFDLVFSDFGGLNCLSPAQVQALGEALPPLMSPGGAFALVVMPRMCLWESFYFLLRLRPAKAFRRFKGGPVQAPLGGGVFVSTWYYGPGQFFRRLGQGWIREAQAPVGIALPPSYLDPFFSRRPRLLQLLDRLEKSLHGQRWLSPVADHYWLLVTRKR